MQTTSLTPNLMQLTRLRFVNAFLVREDDGFTLVDTTMGKVADQVVAAAEAAGGPIRRIAVTHGHGDHVGAVDGLRERLGASVQVLVPELDARILAGEKVVEGKLPGSWPTVTTVPDVRLSAGDRVGSLEVVPTPGHSPGHVSFRDTRDGSVIVGDVFTTYGHVAVTSHFNLRFPFAYFPTWDRGMDLASARAVRALEPSLLAVGHGPAVPDPGAALDAAIARAEARGGQLESQSTLT
ncbi:MAG TPA: MBL fold metallo-hydrolase [Solirubrobacteraceae bacterium]